MSHYDEDEDLPALPDPDREILRDPWTQAPAEPDAAHRLFQEYLASDADSISDFAKAHGLAPSTTAGMAARWRWRARKAAYASHLTAKALAAAEDHAEAMGRAHARLLTSIRDWAEESIVAQRAAGRLLSPSEALRYVSKAIELERLMAGQATARVVDLSAASDEELQELERRLADIERKALAH